MRRFKLVFIVSFSFLSLFCYQKVVYSEEITAGFTVEGVPNDRQIDKNLSYFYLKEEPNQIDEIKVTLINTSSLDKTLQVKIVDGNTNLNGLVDYSGSLKNHATLETPLSTIVYEFEKEVFVPKNTTVETTIKTKMPSESFEGVIVGGIVVSEKTEKEKIQDSLMFRNTYSYTIAVVLTNEESTEIKKQVSVELEKIRPLLFDGRKIVQADILNPNSYIFHDASVTGSIYKKANNKKVTEKKEEKVSIAPHSVYPFMFDWQKRDLEAGTYIFRGKVKGERKTWAFEREFEITSEQSNEINEKSVFKVVIPQWLRTVRILTLLSAIFSTVLVVIRKYRKKG